MPHPAILFTILLPLSLLAVPAAGIDRVEDNLWPFRVTLDEVGGEGTRTQYLGPIVERKELEEHNIFSVRPFYTRVEFKNPELVNRSSFFILYPLFNYRKYNSGHQWSVFEIVRGGNVDQGRGSDYSTFEIFPFYFDHRSDLPQDRYWAFLPFGGTIRNRLFYDRISFVLAPLYMEWERDGQTTHHAPFPFVQWREGADSRGWALWPFYGTFDRPNAYSNRFAAWPFYLDYTDRLDTIQPRRRQGLLPFYFVRQRGEWRSEVYLWPFFGYTYRPDPEYREVRYLWPFLVQGRGEFYLNRWGPIYTHSIRGGLDKKWYLWPILNRKEYIEEGVRVRTWRVLYALYFDQRNTPAGMDPADPATPRARVRHLWPLFSYRKTGDGDRQFQLLSPFEPWMLHNEIVRENWSPLFALYRYESDPEEGWRHSVLFNLVTLEGWGDGGRFTLGPILDLERGDTGGISILKGLFSRRKTGDGGETETRLFWFRL